MSDTGTHDRHRQEQEAEHAQARRRSSDRREARRECLRALMRRTPCRSSTTRPRSASASESTTSKRRGQHGRVAPAQRLVEADADVFGDHHDASAAEDGRGDVEAEREDEDEDAGRDDPRLGQRQEDPEEGLPRPGAEAPGRVDVAAGDGPHVRVHRQHREGQHVVHHADQHADLVADEPQRLVDEAERHAGRC